MPIINHERKGREKMMRLVAVVRSLVRTVDGDVEVLRLDIGENGELDSELSKVSTSDFLIKLLRQDVHAQGELLRGSPESDLRENLVCE